ncbi:hypothetical protein WH47_11412 [Habropoda laboriosa]|uniref:Uncharacterized protein n=1 Tax=Habropoda laboriosa TaxID=597456 RepID=A0A0L7RA00_9HYME|nr:hypothetical protein WH47_11412 [Habropoda laboriosa]
MYANSRKAIGGIVARNKEHVREAPPFSEARRALSGRLVPFINGTTQVYTCEKMKWTMNVDPQQWSDPLSRFTFFVLNNNPYLNRLEKAFSGETPNIFISPK